MAKKGNGKQKRGQGKAQSLLRQNLKIDEPSRIQITQALQNFRASNDQVYTFEANLSKSERALVHQLSLKMGMKSKSSGKSKNRRVSVFKTKMKVDTDSGLDSLPHFSFSGEAQETLGDLFTHYPPGYGDSWEQMVGYYNYRTDKPKQIRDDTFKRPSISSADIRKKFEAYINKKNRDPHLMKINTIRSKLPIAAYEDAIISAVKSNQVVLVCGETGCGKTTQVPQFILDDMWGKGEACKIVCTQPRRISAISVSERIASERGEIIGGHIGYKDEIHERDRYSDFMMAIIRDMLPSYPHLRLILMSATVDAQRFSQYFGGCPIIVVPGFTHPVRTFYLEDVLSIVKSNKDNHLGNTKSNKDNHLNNDDHEFSVEDKLCLDEAIDLAWSNDDWDPLLELISSKGSPEIFDYQHSLTGFTPLMVFAGKGRVGDLCMLLSIGADCQLRARDERTALDIAEQENQLEAAEILKNHMGNASSNSKEGETLLDKYLARVNPEIVDVVLIEQLIRKICTESESGGILVFLPGWDEINKTRDKLLQSPFFSDSKFSIICLHSMIPSTEQKKVFLRPSPGCRKIVLSTNIAETAVTIDDIVYVIDTGRMKEKSYDPYCNVSTLQSSWVSKASAKQREGRAGRCQPGICYHLYSSVRAASLPDFQVPEIKRMPIEELCLQVTDIFWQLALQYFAEQ
ncbi:DExH-box ATP-dependent RNA helicase DExH6-like [Senna tora]|uniref:DExH-box ATP-dependent RNA helicase DExH6-like n=1 Tax=Senna tora TaxID=362788 RepID=A0A834WW74_9FABA|nr:DExH-box ATP-dependent RNA helicase DExH6-like [Senna tora]